MGTCTGPACDFARDYEIALAPLMRLIERRVRGSDYGATSWTTREQAKQTVPRLALQPNLRLLDIGAGSGWPALFLAMLSGCDVVLTDLPLSGLRIARERAASDGLGNRCGVLVADGASLALGNATFDRIHHADVLCCMERKLEMLRECRRVAREGALMEFSVIWLAREPAGHYEQDLLQRSGPAHPDAGADYATLLKSAGWTALERIDVTDEFARCMDVLLEESRVYRSALLDLLGEQDYVDRLERRRSTRTAVALGLLRREIFVAG
jgi:SAM-dependent methyltransferase